MRRIRTTSTTQGRTVVCVLRLEPEDHENRMFSWLFAHDGCEGWVDATSLDINAPFSLNSAWNTGFLFSDGSAGMCRGQHVGAALASCGLRLTEGGE